MMSPSRFQQIWNGTTITARKVYDKVPIQEEWAIKFIYAELTRTGTTLSYTTVSGCLESLRSSGLIRETRNGFKREPIRQTDASPKPEPIEKALMANTPKLEPVPATQAEIVDSLGRLAVSLIATSRRVQEDLAALAEEISNTAIELQARVEIDNEDLSKLHTMRALLKNL